jgi:rare lipoprotein A
MKMFKSVVIVFLVMVLVSGCSEETLQEGTASWYGPGFHGQRTSSGEIYNENDTTAAHRSLPFDTVVRVVNTENDKSVEVRINDRGPYVDGRIIDLSRSAADAIDMLDPGTAPVRLELVEAGGNIPDDIEQRFYTIQVAEYNRPGYAESLAEEIGEEAQVHSDYRDDRTRYRVYYGWYDRIEKAREDLQLLGEKGYDGLVKQVN